MQTTIEILKNLKHKTVAAESHLLSAELTLASLSPKESRQVRAITMSLKGNLANLQTLNNWIDHVIETEELFNEKEQEEDDTAKPS
jgi:hypothetical protein